MPQELIKDLIEGRLGNAILENKKQIITNIANISSNAEDINKMQTGTGWITEGMAKEIFDKSKLDTSKFLGDFPVATGTTDAAIKILLQTNFSHANKGDYVEVIMPTVITGEAEYFLMTRGNSIADWTKGVVRTEHIKAGVAIAWANNANKLLTTDNTGNAVAFIGRGYMGDMHYGNGASGNTYIGWDATGGVILGSPKWIAGDSKGILRHGNEQVTFEQIISKVKEPAVSSGSSTKITLTKTKPILFSPTKENADAGLVMMHKYSSDPSNRNTWGRIQPFDGYIPKRLVALTVVTQPRTANIYYNGVRLNWSGVANTDTGAVYAMYAGIERATNGGIYQVWRVYHSNGTQVGELNFSEGTSVSQNAGISITPTVGTWAYDTDKWWYNLTVEYEKEVTVKT